MATAVLPYFTGNLATPRLLPVVIFPILLTFAHINLCWQLSQIMIEPICGAARLDFPVWTPAAWIPGTFLAHYNLAAGLLVMLLPSILAGAFLWSVIVRLLSGGSASGFASWRCAALLLLWACWIPLPAMDSVAFLFTRWAINVPG